MRDNVIILPFCISLYYLVWFDQGIYGNEKIGGPLGNKEKISCVFEKKVSWTFHSFLPKPILWCMHVLRLCTYLLIDFYVLMLTHNTNLKPNSKK